MLAIGLDLHQKQTAVAVLEMDTGEVRQSKVSTEKVVEYLQGLGDEEKRVVMETGGVSLFVARKLLSLGMDVIVVDAFKSHRVAEAMHTAKTDRLDALVLARLAASGGTPLATWVPDESVDDLRTLTRVRRQVVQEGTRLRNQILLRGKRRRAGRAAGDHADRRGLPGRSVCAIC